VPLVGGPMIVVGEPFWYVASAGSSRQKERVEKPAVEQAR